MHISMLEVNSCTEIFKFMMSWYNLVNIVLWLLSWYYLINIVLWLKKYLNYCHYVTRVSVVSKVFEVIWYFEVVTMCID